MKRFIVIMLAIVTLGVPSVPTIARSHRPAHQQTPQSITVWVNLTTGVYHYPGERWYGHTKNGAYMSEAEARAKGYRPTRNGQ